MTGKVIVMDHPLITHKITTPILTAFTCTSLTAAANAAIVIFTLPPARAGCRMNM